MNRWLATATAASFALAGSTAAADLAAFSARYHVYVDGKPTGESIATLTRDGNGDWLHRIDAEATRGLARLAAFEARQSSRLRVVGEQLRVLSTEASNEHLFKRRSVRALFDWDAGLVRWEGDLPSDRREPLPLVPTAVTGATLNLQLARDATQARAGSALRYRLYERGRSRDVEYVVGAAEILEVPAGRFNAVPLRHQLPERQRITTAWYAAELPPTPVRVLRLQDGRERYELRLAEWRR